MATNCLNCNQEIPEDRRFCNESCVREYFKDRFKNNPKNKVIPNSCKNCFKVIPEGLQFCSKSCMEELKFKQKNPSLFGISLKTQGLEYVEIDNLFTKYANAKGEEKERLKKIIDDNYELSKEYIEAVKLNYEKHPHLPKVSFKKWLNLRKKLEVKNL